MKAYLIHIWSEYCRFARKNNVLSKHKTRQSNGDHTFVCVYFKEEFFNGIIHDLWKWSHWCYRTESIIKTLNMFEPYTLCLCNFQSRASCAVNSRGSSNISCLFFFSNDKWRMLNQLRRWQLRRWCSRNPCHATNKFKSWSILWIGAIISIPLNEIQR